MFPQFENVAYNFNFYCQGIKTMTELCYNDIKIKLYTSKIISYFTFSHRSVNGEICVPSVDNFKECNLL